MSISERVYGSERVRVKKTFYDSRKIKSTCEYAEGKKHGLEMLYNEDGTVISHTTYRYGDKRVEILFKNSIASYHVELNHGRKHGREIFYESDGVTIRALNSYYDNVLNGTSFCYIVCPESGRKLKQEFNNHLGGQYNCKIIDMDGNLLEMWECFQGKRHGKRVIYAADRISVSREFNYVNDKENGERKIYNENGLKEVVRVVDGKKDGLRVVYGDKPFQKEVVLLESFKGDLLDGEVKKYRYVSRYETKELLSVQNYKNGVLFGKSEVYENNKLVSSVLYENGCIVDVVFLEDSGGRSMVFERGTEMVVYKACVSDEGKFVIVSIRVPPCAQRVTALPSRWCDASEWRSESIGPSGRTESGVVVKIVDLDKKEYKSAKSFVFKNGDAGKVVKDYKILEYRVGGDIRSENYNGSPILWNTGGIHVHKYEVDCLYWKRYLD
ncbi:MAG: hypothetical protein Harvfovirus5_53 [Harvfovirus sp.]|uniref:MORN repeat-containing protein n=1 Tax=Harvfovirus sp. TaxID=2487768 RepID=A0A3G5A5I3_9VIRU|nr:MAG: hypothetical protein Harvfovirus5_53 [Harvfovirus sp.]